MSSAQSHKKILVVDDSPAELKLLTQLLEHEGYQAIGVDDPTRIEQTIDAERPSLILLDVVLPDGDGRAVCKGMRAKPATASIPVILITANKPAPNDQAKGVEAGAEDYLVKPLHDQLKRALREK